MASDQRANSVDAPRKVLIHRAVLFSEIWWQIRRQSGRQTLFLFLLFHVEKGDTKAPEPGPFPHWILWAATLPVAALLCVAGARILVLEPKDNKS